MHNIEKYSSLLYKGEKSFIILTIGNALRDLTKSGRGLRLGWQLHLPSWPMPPSFRPHLQASSGKWLQLRSTCSMPTTRDFFCGSKKTRKQLYVIYTMCCKIFGKGWEVIKVGMTTVFAIVASAYPILALFASIIWKMDSVTVNLLDTHD